jgi:hypothetical protein
VLLKVACWQKMSHTKNNQLGYKVSILVGGQSGYGEGGKNYRY